MVPNLPSSIQPDSCPPFTDMKNKRKEKKTKKLWYVVLHMYRTSHKFLCELGKTSGKQMHMQSETVLFHQQRTRSSKEA